MNLDQLRETQPTISHARSQAVVLEMMHRPDWRCYSSRTVDNIEELIDDYLTTHARMPGFVSREMYAKKPLMIFGWRDPQDVHYKGCTYMNGGVYIVTPPKGEQVMSLFIEDATAYRYNYPEGDGDYVMLGEIIRQEVEEEEAERDPRTEVQEHD